MTYNTRHEKPDVPALAQVLLFPRVTALAGKFVEGIKKRFLICSRSSNLSDSPSQVTPVVKTGSAHMMHVQTTSGVLRSPRVGNATMKSLLWFQ